MKVIYKYPLEIIDVQLIALHKGYRILSAQEQNGELVLWAFIDTSQPESNVKIGIFGTGHHIGAIDEETAGWEYISTLQASNGLVWHVFDVK